LASATLSLTREDINAKTEEAEDIKREIMEENITSKTFGRMANLLPYQPPAPATNEAPWFSIEQIMIVYIPVLVLIFGAVAVGVLLARYGRELAEKRRRSVATKARRKAAAEAGDS
jgi:hypothetical protein